MTNFKIQLKEDVGKRLDRFLTSKFSDFSRSKIQKYIRNGDVIVNGENCKTGYLLEVNDIVKILINFKAECKNNLVPEPLDLEIIFEDFDIIVLNKPAGLVVHPGAGIFSGTLANGLKYYFNDLSELNGSLRPGIIHRLDADTSGIMVIAKTDKAHRFISQQFQKREIKKEYIAITWGKWFPRKGSIEKPISRKKKDPTSFCINKEGRLSYTEFKLKEYLNHFSIVSFFPKTGRTHQIRVHSNYLGFPIFGDKKYGGGKSKTLGFLPEYKKIYSKFLDNFDGHALHANKISFVHPKTKDNVMFEIDMPNRFFDLINSIKLVHER